MLKITGFFMCSLLDKGRHFIITLRLMIKYAVSHHCKKWVWYITCAIS